MAVSRDVRYHEAAHAVAAYTLGIGLKEESMILISDQKACVNVTDLPADEIDEDWFIQRVGAKLAGPLAMCLLRNERLEWDTLKDSGEYHTDFEESLCIFAEYWRRVGGGCSNEQVDEQMNRAACIALKCVQNNEGAIIAVVDATAGRDQFSRTEITSTVLACCQYPPAIPMKAVVHYDEME